jgi:hypothetical protein
LFLDGLKKLEQWSECVCVRARALGAQGGNM